MSPDVPDPDASSTAFADARADGGEWKSASQGSVAMAASVESHPASFGQSALWLAKEVAPHPSAFNLLWSVELRGPLDGAALRRGLARIVERHDALRAVFILTSSGLEQRISPSAGKIDCPVFEMEGVASPELRKAARAFGHFPFDIVRGPLYRFKLLRLAPRHHLLLCGFHHLVIDGRSWEIFVDELSAELSGAKRSLHNGDYAAFSAWQRQSLASGRWAAASAYWCSVYATAPAALALPTDRPRPRSPDHAGSSIISTLPDDKADLLRAACARMGSTPFRIGLAAFFAFLYRITGQSDLLLPTTLIGRSGARFGGVIGLFANTGGIRLRVEGSMRFDQLAAAVSAQLDLAVRHQDYPYSLAVRDAAPRRESGRDPFSPVAFTKTPTHRLLHAGDLTLAGERISLDECRHDFSVHMHDGDGTFVFTWLYATGLFERSTIERLAGQYEELLGHALAVPQSPLAQLTLVPPAERRRILVEWNATGRSYPPPFNLPAMVEAQAARTPERVAAVSPRGELTYRQVNAAANRVAAELRAGGAGRGDFLPVLMETSAEALIAELAVMKAGAAFVPLDPGWPKQRLARLVDKLDPRVILVRQPEDAARLEMDRRIIIVGLEPDPADARGDARPNPEVDIAPDDPIYCIFTSGSTGMPKGAINRHRGIVNRLSAMTERFGSPDGTSVLATSPTFADSSVWQYFWALTGGGRSVIFPAEQTANPALVPSLVARHAINFMDAVPSLFRLLLEHLRRHPEKHPAFACLRHMLMGGEAMPAEAVYAFKAMFPHVALTNTYGPTETSIGVIFNDVPEAHTDPVPIGRPLPNVRAVVLDRNLDLVPIGVAGELCLGGDCVGLGYLGDPSATASAFVANPFPELACDVLYRTGDLARFRADGVIEFLGRIDEQVKIRGLRVEPGEIEMTIMRHPAVRQAVVVPRENAGGEKHFVAFIVAEAPGLLVDARELREFLAIHLPSYMIPALFLLVDALPLAPGGKIDRAAASRLDGRELWTGASYEAPRNDLERRIVDIWRDLLERDRIGVHDDFFLDLGGDSLLAIQFVALLAERTGFSLGVRSIFEIPTPAKLAASLAADAASADPDANPQSADAEALEAILAKQRPLLASWKGKQLAATSFLRTLNHEGIQPGLFWCLQGYRELTQLARVLGPDRPVHGMRSGHLVMTYTERNIETLASHYALEMMALQPSGPFLVGGNCQGALIARAVACSLEKHGRQVARLILVEEGSFRGYGGDVALLFGRDSHCNPYNRPSPAADPEETLRASYPGGYTVDFISGAHGQFFDEPNLSSLGEAVARRLRLQA